MRRQAEARERVVLRLRLERLLQNRSRIREHLLGSVDVTQVPLDRSQRKNRFDKINRGVSVFRISLAQLAKQLNLFLVLRQSFIRFSQVDVLLPQVVEVVAEKLLVLDGGGILGHGELLLPDGGLEMADCRAVVPPFVLKDSQVVQAQCQGAVKARRFRLSPDELREDVDRPPGRSNGLVVVPSLVLELGNLAVTQREFLPKPGDGWVLISQVRPVLERFLEERQSFLDVSVLLVDIADVVLRKCQQVQQPCRRGSVP